MNPLLIIAIPLALVILGMIFEQHRAFLRSTGELTRAGSD